MSGVNKVIILGRLGRDPEISYTPSGMAVCKFSLATSRKKKDGSEITQWHRCTAFDKLGETIAQYLSKGRELFIEGELQYSQYEKDGIKRYSTDIIVRQFNFVGSASSPSQYANTNQTYQSQPPQQQQGYQQPQQPQPQEQAQPQQGGGTLYPPMEEPPF